MATDCDWQTRTTRKRSTTLDVVLRERAGWEALDEVRGEAHLVLRTDRPLDHVVAELIAVLDERLWQAASGCQ